MRDPVESILGRLKPRAVAVEVEAPAPDDLDVAAEELLAAIEAKDAAGVSRALRAAYSMCASAPMEEAEEA
jgi:hypothetical protein